MPIYKYICLDCRQTQEYLRKMYDPTIPYCPTCGGELRKCVTSPGGFKLIGDGFYKPSNNDGTSNA